jgi:hypothetical protein
MYLNLLSGFMALTYGNTKKLGEEHLPMKVMKVYILDNIKLDNIACIFLADNTCSCEKGN